MGHRGLGQLQPPLWTHDSELSAVVVDPSAPTTALRARLRLRLAAEHLDRTVEGGLDPADPDALLEAMADCVDPAGFFAA